MFYKNAKEHIVNDYAFDHYVYSDVGKEVKINSMSDDDVGFSINDYGSMRRMVMKSILNFKQNIPWEDTNIVDTTKNTISMRDTDNKLVVKHATIDIDKLKYFCHGNRDMMECIDYLCKMLLHKDSKISSYLYTLWNDCMKEKRFCVEKYTYNETVNRVTTVTFRFVAIKWHNTWDNEETNIRRNNFRNRKTITVDMGCDRPARVNIQNDDCGEDYLTPEEEAIMAELGPKIFGTDTESKPVKHNVVVVSKHSDNSSEELPKPDYKNTVMKKPIDVSINDEEKATIASIANLQLG